MMDKGFMAAMSWKLAGKVSIREDAGQIRVTIFVPPVTYIWGLSRGAA